VSTSGLVAWLDMAFGAEPAGAFIEVRWRLPDRPGMGQLWHPVERRGAAIESIRSIGAGTDCFAGACPRVRREGGRGAVERGHVLWVDLDSPESIEALECFEPAPSMVIRSGGGGKHAYWSIWPPLAPDWLERANKRLALALDADMRATDCARILRPPGSTNWKTSWYALRKIAPKRSGKALSGAFARSVHASVGSPSASRRSSSLSACRVRGARLSGTPARPRTSVVIGVGKSRFREPFTTSMMAAVGA